MDQADVQRAVWRMAHEMVEADAGADDPILIGLQTGGVTIAEALASANVPAGVFALVMGTEAGATALKDPRVKAAGFTGSIPGGRALFDMANARREPIPFYGELGSNNPVFVTAAAGTTPAARARMVARSCRASSIRR